MADTRESGVTPAEASSENREGETTYEGVLVFHSETGTEGGYWALQDKKFMNIPDDSQLCGACGYMREYVEGVRHQDDLQAVQSVPLSSAISDKMPDACLSGDHKWELQFPDGAWSYEGLHVLDDGDRLTIYDKEKPEETVWEGTISLTPLTVFQESVFGGIWIHNDQIGVARETWANWFLEQYPARLTVKQPQAEK